MTKAVFLITKPNEVNLRKLIFMSDELFEKIKRLPPEKLEELDEYVDKLLNNVVSEKDKEATARKRLKNMGRLKGQVWMADDFNETPEDFKDYI